MNIQTPIQAQKYLAQNDFDPLRFFDGAVKCHGFIADRGNRVRKHFVIDFAGTRKGDHIDIAETITYQDGELSYRQWEIRARADGKGWDGKANDIASPILIRPGAKGWESRWRYGMALPVSGRNISFDFEDIMVQTDAENMVALTDIRKFGITVAQIVSSYRRV